MARGQVFDRLIPTEKPKRNGFDLSFANNFSTKFGTLTPVLCKEVIPGDTFNIQSAFGLKLMPMYFPVQTRMRARIHFFYVRNRNLWKNWKKFLRGDRNVVMPYIDGSPAHMYDFFSQGRLADYLGIPTNVATTFMETQVLGSTSSAFVEGKNAFNGWDFDKSFRNKEYFTPGSMLGRDFSKAIQNTSFQGTVHPPVGGIGFISASSIKHKLTNTSEFLLPFTSTTMTPPSNIVVSLLVLRKNTSVYPRETFRPYSIVGVAYDESANKPYFSMSISDLQYSYRLSRLRLYYTPVGVANNNVTVVEFINNLLDNESGNDYYLGVVVHDIGFKALDTYDGFSDIQITNCEVVSNPETLNVFQSGRQKVNALPFRAYESIFNAIYRNTQNDPFRINGNIEYDQLCTTLEDGADTTDYHLFQDYWEKDFLTTCLPSPQDGNAPLLGLSSSGDGAFSNPYVLRYTSEDGTNQQIFVEKDGSGHLVFSHSNTSDEKLQGDIQALNEAAQFGISINDLRNVNSLQRWLEKNIANGYRYKDIIESHFGIEISLKELEMPEFIGGVTQDINVNSVTQTSEDGNTPLGWQVGNASAFGNTKKISKYCDEHGFIIGLLSVVPIPSYSQLLPKMFTKFGQLDYFTPEFAHIGLQPVTYREVCPIQADYSNVSLETVFGYNRAFYDYLASTDEVHGEFRGSLRDFLMNRVFSAAPELGHDFLVIDPAQVNNVFNVTMASDHKIYGQVYFDIVAERPIPLYNEPRLE